VSPPISGLRCSCVSEPSSVALTQRFLAPVASTTTSQHLAFKLVAVGSGQLEVACRVGDREYKKHFLGLSDNVTYFAEQLAAARVSANHYRVIFKPQAIISDIDFRESGEELLENTSEAEAIR